MADALYGFLLGKLDLLIQKEIGLIWGVDKEMRKLKSLLSAIKAVLKDAEVKPKKGEALHDWLSKLKDAAYKVDDILDECATEAAVRFESNGQNSSLINKVRTSCLTPHNILFRCKIGSRMRDIRERLDDIAEERSKFHLNEGGAERLSDVIGNRQTGSIGSQPQVYGREEDIKNIVECLVEKAACSDGVSVYPILGLGGLGKTTLAQMVFKDDKIESHFQPRIWVCISDDFCEKRIMKAIIESAKLQEDPRHVCENLENLELDSLQRKLQDTLNGKRYLLVLDDVWNENQEQWDRLKCVLACGSRGASIIVTTRIETVASFMGTMPLHRLSSLTEDDCWSLFKERAFRQETEERPNLVALGKKIVNKCGGVPLAVKSLGSMMSNKSEENQWISVVESELWNLSQDECSILPALRLSYYNLPSYLRQCFAYCAIFPKDFIIKKDLLIQLWMANGFIPSTGNLDLEDKGNEICKELCWRSFLEDNGEDGFGYVKVFKMHDLVHDLAQSIMEDECVVDHIESSIGISKRTFHYASIHDGRRVNTFPKAIYQVETLRTCLIHSTYGRLHVARRFSFDFSRLRHLRVLDARWMQGMRRLPSSISHLKHLRYLDLSQCDFEVLPESICTLYNLQTLNLNGCEYLQKLPKHTTRLKNLRHLYLDSCQKLSKMPPEIGQITCLKTLTRFIVGKKRGCHLDELKGLNLGGTLRIKHLQRVENPWDAKEANLVEKLNLRRLSLSWENDSDLQSQEDVEKVLEALQPHTNLKRLEISGYKGDQFPSWSSWMRDNIRNNNVVYIEISNCDNCSQLPSLALLPFLRTLHLSDMSRVMYIDDHFQGGGMATGFPSLQSLKIENLPSLQRFSREDGRKLLPRLTSLIIVNLPSLQRFSREDGRKLLPCLTSLIIVKCPKLTSLQHLPSVEQLTVSGCNEVVLGSISNLKNLISLEVRHNDELNYLPEGTLLNLTSLKTLNIYGFRKLKCLPTEIGSLSSLENLFINGCYELESFPEQGMEGLKRLKYLTLESCSKFTSLTEGLQHLSCLEYLSLFECPELVALPDGMKYLTSLCHLQLLGSSDRSIDSKLEVLPDVLRYVPALKSLEISSYSNLESLPHWLGDLTSLQTLSISGCPKLPSLPASIQGLTMLQNLSISGCSELVALPDGMKYFTSLCHLKLDGWNGSKLEVLPDALRYVPALQSMSISEYPNLESLPHWLGDLTSLQTLEIISCPKLPSLPASIQGLTMLQNLYIRGCPELEKRSEKEKGEDWYKIAHIPDVEIRFRDPRPCSMCLNW